MAIYLVEDHIGSDTNSIGFPNLSTCMGLVVQTTTRLYGYHVTGLHEQPKTQMLRELIETTEPGAQMIHLYGTCYWANRYASLPGTPLAPQWEAEMDGIANTLGYAGPVTGFNIGSWYSLDPAAKIALSHIRRTENTYVEYHRQVTTNKCAIFYKKMAKVNATSGQVPADMHVERIRRVRGPTPSYTRTGPHHGLSVIGATVRTTDRNHGQLHSIPDHFIRTFNKTAAPAAPAAASRRPSSSASRIQPAPQPKP